MTGAERLALLRSRFETLEALLARDDTPAYAAQRILEVLDKEIVRYSKVRAERNVRPLLEREKPLPSAGQKLLRSSDGFESQRKRGRRRTDELGVPISEVSQAVNEYCSQVASQLASQW